MISFEIIAGFKGFTTSPFLGTWVLTLSLGRNSRVEFPESEIDLVIC